MCIKSKDFLLSCLKAVHGDKGRVHFSTLSRDLGATGLAQFILGNCDLSRTEGQDETVNVTGWGANQWQAEIKSALKIQ